MIIIKNDELIQICYKINLEIIMKKYNVIVIFNKEMTKTLMCIRTKEPYIGMYNLVGGKVESDDKLEWVSIDDNFFNMNKYAGEET
jgi:hypothetical protein